MCLALWWGFTNAPIHPQESCDIKFASFLWRSFWEECPALHLVIQTSGLCFDCFLYFSHWLKWIFLLIIPVNFCLAIWFVVPHTVPKCLTCLLFAKRLLCGRGHSYPYFRGRWILLYPFLNSSECLSGI